ncbi:hypothetical protein AB1N83_014404 [Pleurotus pulmonarius]
MGRLPVELVAHILEELRSEWITLKNFSLTCSSWRVLSLPFLFRRLSIPNRGKLIACMALMRSAPYIRPHIRELVLLYGSQGAAPKGRLFVLDIDYKAFFSGFPNVATIRCGASPLADILPILPNMPVTSLHVREWHATAPELLSFFESCATTTRSLTFHTVSFLHPPVNRDMLHVGVVTLPALKDLVFLHCSRRLPLYPKIDMPSLEVLYCAEWCSKSREEFPDSLVTLAVDWDLDHPLVSCRPFSVENLSIVWDFAWSWLSSVMPLVHKLSIPSRLQHLEVLICDNEDWHFHLNDLAANDTFEAAILALHEGGSLRRVTFTLTTERRNAWEEQLTWKDTIGDKFSELKLLGILEYRFNQSSVIYPRQPFNHA